MDAEARERLVRLEIEHKLMHEQNQKELTQLRELLKNVAESQNKITNRMMKFDGAFWIIMTMAGVLGFVISNFKYYLLGKV